MPFSRRHFLQAAGAGAAVWVPSPVKGYSATELTRRAETSGAAINELGVSIWDLDTPALIVDLDVLEANIATMQRTVARLSLIHISEPTRLGMRSYAVF